MFINVFIYISKLSHTLYINTLTKIEMHSDVFSLAGVALTTVDPDLDTQRTHLQKLIQANEKLAQVESLQNLVPTLLSLAREVTSAEASSFLIYDPELEVLRFANIQDQSISDRSKLSLKESIVIRMGEGIACKAAQSKQPIIINDAQKNPQFYNKVDKSTGFITRSILAVPVLDKGELLGVIEAINAKNKDCFDTSERDLLVSLSNLVAVAIIRSRLLEER